MYQLQNKMGRKGPNFSVKMCIMWQIFLTNDHNGSNANINNWAPNYMSRRSQDLISFLDYAKLSRESEKLNKILKV